MSLFSTQMGIHSYLNLFSVFCGHLDICNVQFTNYLNTFAESRDYYCCKSIKCGSILNVQQEGSSNLHESTCHMASCCEHSDRCTHLKFWVEPEHQPVGKAKNVQSISPAEVWYDCKLHLILTLRLWNYEECGEPQSLPLLPGSFWLVIYDSGLKWICK